MPVWLTRARVRGPPGCLRPDAALRPRGTGGRGGRSGRLHRHPAGRVHLRPAADLGRRPDVGSGGRRGPLRPLPLPERAGRAGLAHAHRRLARAARARVQRSGDRAPGDVPARAGRARATTSCRSTARSSVDGCGPTKTFCTTLYGHCCEGMYGAPEYGGNRDGVGWSYLGRDGDVQPRGLQRRRGVGPMTVDAIIIGSGPGGSTAAEVLTRAGWSVVIMEKGRNHLLDPRRSHQAGGRLLQRRDQVHGAPLLGARPPRRAPRLSAQRRRRRAHPRGGGELHPVHRRRRRHACRREGAALSRGGLPRCCRPTGRRTTPTWRTGR